MDETLIFCLIEITSHILAVIGLAYIPLIVLIIFRAGRLRGINEENAADRAMDLCFDTLREQIEQQIDKCLKLDFGRDYVLPDGKTLTDISFFLSDYENFDELLTILKNLSETGMDSQEFFEVLLFLMQ